MDITASLLYTKWYCTYTEMLSGYYYSMSCRFQCSDKQRDFSFFFKNFLAFVPYFPLSPFPFHLPIYLLVDPDLCLLAPCPPSARSSLRFWLLLSGQLPTAHPHPVQLPGGQLAKWSVSDATQAAGLAWPWAVGLMEINCNKHRVKGWGEVKLSSVSCRFSGRFASSELN